MTIRPFKLIKKEEIVIKRANKGVNPDLLVDEALLNMFEPEVLYKAHRFTWENSENNNIEVVYAIPCVDSPIVVDCNEEEFDLYFEEVKITDADFIDIINEEE